MIVVLGLILTQYHLYYRTSNTDEDVDYQMRVLVSISGVGKAIKAKALTSFLARTVLPWWIMVESLRIITNDDAGMAITEPVSRCVAYR